MKLEKAIEILDIHQADMPRKEAPDLIDAIKLGIEALKRDRVWRQHDPGGVIYILPGETEDEPKTPLDPSISTVSTGEGKMP